MPQKLILPINKCLVTASCKTAAYKARFGFSHYGADMVSSSGQSTVYASGNGIVLATGLDSLLGNVVIIRYDDVLNHKTGEVRSVIARYFHLHQILVQPDMVVDSDTKLALYGNTGKYSAGAHLHIEFDTNVASPQSSKTIGGDSNIIKSSRTDTTIDPFELLHCKADPPDNQQIAVDASTYMVNGIAKYYANPDIINIPRI